MISPKLFTHWLRSRSAVLFLVLLNVIVAYLYSRLECNFDVFKMSYACVYLDKFKIVMTDNQHALYNCAYAAAATGVGVLVRKVLNYVNQ